MSDFKIGPRHSQGSMHWGNDHQKQHRENKEHNFNNDSIWNFSNQLQTRPFKVPSNINFARPGASHVSPNQIMVAPFGANDNIFASHSGSFDNSFDNFSVNSSDFDDSGDIRYKRSQTSSANPRFGSLTSHDNYVSDGDTRISDRGYTDRNGNSRNKLNIANGDTRISESRLHTLNGDINKLKISGDIESVRRSERDIVTANANLHQETTRIEDENNYYTIKHTTGTKYV